MSLLREALGGKHRHHLAMEEQLVTSDTDGTVLMKGPLANVYAAALDEVYNKENPSSDPTAPPEPSAETGTNVPADATIPEPGTALEVTETTTIPEVTAIVLESQAMDAAVISALAAQATTEAPKNDTEYATLYAIDESQIDSVTTVEVTQMLAEADRPEDIAVLIDNVMPADETVEVTDAQANKTEQMVIGLESLVKGLGGKVYRNFPDYVASRRK